MLNEMKTHFLLLSSVIAFVLFGCKTGNNPEDPQVPSVTEGTVVTLSKISIHTENRAVITLNG